MSDSTKKTIFSLIGAVQLLFALILFCGVCLGLIGLLSIAGGNELLDQYGESGVDSPSALFTIVSLGIGVLATVMYAVSAYGFFQLKKWQPLLFTGVIGLTLIQMFVNFLNTGFSPLIIISVLFIFIWVGLLAFTWMNKHLFTN